VHIHVLLRTWLKCYRRKRRPDGLVEIVYPLSKLLLAESLEEFNKEIERCQKVTAGKAADTAEALKTERIRLEKLEKLNREGSPTLTELQHKELVKKVEERFKYTISTRNIASCFLHHEIAGHSQKLSTAHFSQLVA